MTFDTQQHLAETAGPFQVKYRTIRYNAYQAANNNYVGFLVDDVEDLVEVRVKLPSDKMVGKDPSIEVRKKGGEEWASYLGKSEVTVDGDRRSFVWHLEKPAAGYAYRATIDWTTVP